MKRVYLLAAFLVSAAAFSFGQSTMMGTSSSNGSATDMMSPNSSTGSATDMMSANGSNGNANTMSAKPMTADPVVGNKLRFAPSTGTKVAFTTLQAAEALAAKQPTVLFFAADWCPYCQADLKDINANGRKLGNLAIVVANYDTAKQLKAKYDITVQDIFVQIDSSGAVKAIWNGGGEGVDGILSHVVGM